MKNFLVFCMTTLMLLASSPFERAFGQESKRIFLEIHAPRHVNSICPHEYTTAREGLELYLAGSRYMDGPKFDELLEDFRINRLAIEEFELLTDRENSRECDRLNQMHSAIIDKQVQLFEDVMPEYLYDISYYKASGFYFVVVSGGTLIQEDPLNPDLEAFHAAKFGSYVNVFDADWNPIRSRSMRELMAEMKAESENDSRPE